MLDAVRTLGWLACVVYSTVPAFWLVIHSRVEYWRSRRASPYRVLVPLWMGMWIALAMITARWRHVTLYRSSWAWFTAAPLFAVGIWLYRKSGVNISLQQLSGVPELQAGYPEQVLVTSGMHAHVRHPVYLAHLCEMLAWSLGTGFAVCYGLTAFAVIAGTIMIRMEDSELERRFGAPYRAYRDSVPAVFPKLGEGQSRL